MLTLGIFAKTFLRPSLDAVLTAVQHHGLDCFHFNFACANLPSLPDSIPSDLASQIRQRVTARRMTMAGVSGTCNLIHPDPARREEGLRRLETLIGAAPGLGSPLVSLCTGTRDPDSMWQFHPDNGGAEAWRDLCRALDRVLSRASEHDIVLGVEPEIANVMNSAPRARQLLDDMRSPHLKIILDPANLIPPAALHNQSDIIKEAVALLSGDLVMAHAKELGGDGHPLTDLAAGQGRLNWACYLHQLQQAGYSGPLMLHGCAESAVGESLRFLRQQQASSGK